MRWILPKTEIDDRAQQLSRELAVGAEPFPLSLAQLLVVRGVDEFEKARTFFRPEKNQLHDPFLMKDMETAVSRILTAVENEEKILIYGDYDVDGTTSVTLLSLFFDDWGIDYDYYIPDRYSEGYGLSFKGVDYAHSGETDLMILLDCGTKAIDKVKYAGQKGIDVIICDHHTPGEEIPPAVALINQKQKDCTYPFKEFSAAGIGLKLVQALTQRFSEHPILKNRQNDYDALDRYADLVALSIACDIVPMVGENRVITYYGLKKIQENPLPGIRAMMNLSQVNRAWEVSDLVFFLGPRINSAGRLGDARRAVKLLRGTKGLIEEFALELHDSNSERQELDSMITGQALRMIEDDPGEMMRNSTVLFQADWHKGVIGIVASRLIETHYRPTILLTQSNGHWVGSGRSVHDFDLYEALQHCEENLVQFGGHKYAAGLTLKEDQLRPFKEKFEAFVAQNIREDQKEPLLEIAAKIDFSYILPKFIRLIKRFAPFGPGNMEPVFVAERVRVTNFRVLKDVHLRLNLMQKGIPFEAIGFGLAKKWNEINQTTLDIAFQPDFKTWNDKTYIQLKLKDIRPSS